MKRLISIILILVGICWAQETNKLIWEEKSPMPVGHHSGTSVSCSGFIYHIGGAKKYGNSWYYSKDGFKYEIASNKWSKLTNMPTARMNIAGAVVDGKIYVIGGDPFLNNNEMYNPETNTWVSLEPMPTKRQHIKAAVVGSKIYIFGGLESYSKISSKTEVYDTKTNKWETKKPMPVGKHNYSVAVLNGKVYVFGGAIKEGNNVWSFTSSVEMYDPETDTWETVSTMPTRRFNPGIGVINNKILIVGGFAGEIVSNRIDIFDPETKNWGIGTSLIKNTIAMGSACFNNKIYIVGGSDGKGNIWNWYNSVFEGSFEPLTNIEKIEEIPNGFELEQNYPNPFNPSTTISFNIPEPSKVRIDLFNNLGEKVEVLLDKEYDRGSHSVKFNFTDLPSGVYYYKMITANFQETRKMILVK